MNHTQFNNNRKIEKLVQQVNHLENKLNCLADSCCTSVPGPRGPKGPAGGVINDIWRAVSNQGFSSTGQIVYNVSTLPAGNPDVSYADDFIVGAPGAFSTNGVTGARMYFLPGNRGAFRAGIVDGAQWDNPGPASVAFGINCTASAEFSFAEGAGNTASGDVSHAEGVDNLASGTSSHAEGYSNKALGNDSHVEGRLNTTIGLASHAEGQGNIASKDYSHAEGLNNLASGFASHAEGQNNIASGDYSHAEGLSNLASNFGSHAEGLLNSVSGFASHAEGFTNNASGFTSHAEGQNNIASGDVSHAEGFNNLASGIGSHVEGQNNTASGLLSHAEGLITDTNNIEGVHIMGIYGKAQTGTDGVTGQPDNGGRYSWQLAGGNLSPTNTGDGISVIIRTAIAGTPQPVGEIITNFFTVGNADYAEYFEWLDGNPNKEIRVGYFVGLVNDKIVLAESDDSVIGITSLTPCVVADSAELGWSETNVKDCFGVCQTTDCYSVPMASVLATYGYTGGITGSDKQTIINNIISEFRPSLITRVKDIINKPNTYDRIITPIMKTLTNPVLSDIVTAIINKLTNELNAVHPVQATVTNPNYDSTKPYVPRSKRPEWIPVGLMGKVAVRDNGLCQVGSKCSCVNGIAVPGTKYHILKRTADNVIQVLMK